MSSPPAKRRRMSQSSAARNAGLDQIRSAPATPSRASYRSPTKASLQRSHPHLANRNASLRNHVMDLAPTAKIQQTPAEHSTPLLPPLNHDDDAQVVGVKNGGENTEDIPDAQSEPRAAGAMNDRADRGGFGLTQVPRLVASSQSRRRELSLSPDANLPPTPVALGISAQPEEPRGLSSSSPRSSRHGSGKNRLRRRERASITSSPLRPKSHNIQRDRISREKTSQINDAPESEDESREPEDETESMPGPLREKHALLKQLQAQKSLILAAHQRLEHAVKSNNVSSAIKSDPTFIELLKSAGHARTVHDGSVNFPPAKISQRKELLNLNLFAPGNLALDFSSFSRLVDKRAKVIHNIKVSAPKPWPARTFSATFQVTTDAEDVRVEKVALEHNAPKHALSTELEAWVEERLTSSLFQTDLSGLIWGLGNYFTASIERAKLFHNLSQKYCDSVTGIDDDDGATSSIKSGKNHALTADEAVELAAYLTETQLELRLQNFNFERADGDNSSSTSSTGQRIAPKILLVCTIGLDSMSTASTHCHVVLSGVSDAAQKAAKHLFAKLAETVGYERAFEGVWDLISGAAAEVDDHADDPVSGADKGKQKATTTPAIIGKAKKKRKRIA